MKLFIYKIELINDNDKSYYKTGIVISENEEEAQIKVYEYYDNRTTDYVDHNVLLNEIDMKENTIIEDVIETNKRSFIQVYTEILQSDLFDNPYQIVIYIYLKMFTFLDNDCCPSLKTFSKLTKMSVSQVRRSLNELEQKGIITRVHRTGTDNGNLSNKYILFDNEEIWNTISNNIDKNTVVKRSKTQCKILKKSACNSDGIIYIMKNCGYYKIGRALSETRLGEYTKLPEEPEYVVKELVHDYGSVELTLHEMFKSKRLRDKKCEWFDLTNEDVKKAQNYINNFVVKNVS